MTTGLVQMLYGLRVASQIPLYVDRPATQGLDVDVDVDIVVGEPRTVPSEAPPGKLLAQLEIEGRRFYTFTTLDSGDHVLRHHGAVEFVVSADLSTVSAHCDPDADPGLASVLANGSLLSFIMLMRGDLILHASAVDVGNRAVAFVGHAGKGKSTMATLMCAAGARIITDDVLRVDLSGPIARCHLGTVETRLRKAAVELAEQFASSPAVRHTSDERHAISVGSGAVDLLPLAAIIVPQPRRDLNEVVVERVSGVSALLTLSSFPRLVGWEETSVQARHFEQLAELLDGVPLYLGNVPWGPPFARDIAPRLLEGIGLPALAAS